MIAEIIFLYNCLPCEFRTLGCGSVFLFNSGHSTACAVLCTIKAIYDSEEGPGKAGDKSGTSFARLISIFSFHYFLFFGLLR